MIDKKEKFVLCKGWSGFGDRMECLMMIIEYSIITGRILVIDWNDKIWSDDFNFYFNINNLPNISFKDFLKDKKDGSYIPSVWNKNNINTKLQDITEDILLSIDKEKSENKYNYDIIKICNKEMDDYTQDIVVYTCFGTRINNLITKHFDKISFTNNIINEIQINKTYQNLLGKEYQCIHLRGTDRKGSFMNNNSQNEDEYIYNIVNKLNKYPKDIVILTDDIFLLKKIKNCKYLDGFNLHFGNIPLEYSKGMHTITDNDFLKKNNKSKRLLNIEMLQDFVLMLGSSEILNDDISYFSQFAKHIRQNCNGYIFGIPKVNCITKTLLTFGGGEEKYIQSCERLKNQAIDSKLFENIIVYNDIDLMKDELFQKMHGDFIKKNIRGYGYWIWKPYIIKKTMNSLKNGDILLYLDSGCQLPTNRWHLLENLFQICKKDLLIGSDLSYQGYNFDQNIAKEINWCKSDIFHIMGIKYEDNVLNTVQREAGCVMYLVCKETRNLIDEWYALCCNYHLIDDSPSLLQNEKEFIENRHDQSLFSLLSKKHNLFSCHQIHEGAVVARVPKS